MCFLCFPVMPPWTSDLGKPIPWHRMDVWNSQPPEARVWNGAGYRGFRPEKQAASQQRVCSRGSAGSLELSYCFIIIN